MRSRPSRPSPLPLHAGLTLYSVLDVLAGFGYSEGVGDGKVLDVVGHGWRALVQRKSRNKSVNEKRYRWGPEGWREALKKEVGQGAGDGAFEGDRCRAGGVTQEWNARGWWRVWLV